MRFQHIHNYVIVLLLLKFSVLNSQNEFFNNGSAITVQSGGLVYVQGEVINTDNSSNLGNISNSGTISLSGDWTNNSTTTALLPTSGTVELIGALQIIKGTQSTTFNNLTLLGTNIKRLNVNTFVGGTNGILSLTTRTLDLNSKTLFVTNPLASAITRTSGLIWSETSAVPGYGTIQWNLANNTGNYEFPFGTLNGDYIPFFYNVSSSGVQSANGNVSASTYPTNTSLAINNRPLPTGVLDLNNNCNTDHAKKMVDRFWVINANNYSTLPVVTEKMTYVDDEWNTLASSTNIITEPLLNTWYYSSVGWATINSTNNSSTNEQTIPLNSNYGVFTLGEYKQISIDLIKVDSVVCFGESNGVIQFSTTVGYDLNSYSWNSITSTDTIKTNLTAGNYTIIATDVMGCSDTLNRISVDEPTPLILNLTASDYSICKNQSTQLTSQYSGGVKPYTLIWSAGLTSTNLTNASSSLSVSPGVSQNYSTTLTDAKNCITNDTVFVNVNQLPIIDFDADTYAGCQPVTVNFTNLSAANPVINLFAWTFNSSSLSNLTNPSYVFGIPGSYSITLQATSDSGCVASLTKNNFITVYANPQADFSYSPSKDIDNLVSEIQFQNNSTGNYVTSDWTFGNGASSTETNPSHPYYESGTYKVTLIVTTIHNCVDSISKQLFVQDVPTLYIPNAFTPGNADGINDFFTVKGINFSEFEMLIFDRWGNKIFETTDASEGWNGRIKNQLCQQGVYIYKINYKFLNGKEKGSDKSAVGHITLLN